MWLWREGSVASSVSMRSYSSLFHPEGLSKEVLLAIQIFSAYSCLFLFILAMQRWASAHPKNDIQSFLVVHRKCIAAAADRAESMFKCFQCFASFVAFFHSSAPLPFTAWFWISWPFIHAVMHQSTCPSIRPANDPLLLSLGCVLSQQHLIKRHVMVRRHQSWKTRSNSVISACGRMYVCVCVCFYECGACAQQNAGICPFQVKMETDLFSH